MDRTHLKAAWYKVKIYLIEVLLGLDKFANAVFFGSHKETISSRVGKRVTTNPVCFVIGGWINSVFFWQKDHVTASIRKIKDWRY